MRRLTFLTGYFGSGKSEIAVNLAIQGKVKYLVDLDVINPYFRSREADVPLREAGVVVISSPLKDAIYADMPYLSKDVFKPFFDPFVKAIFDLGGNDLGCFGSIATWPPPNRSISSWSPTSTGTTRRRRSL